MEKTYGKDTQVCGQCSRPCSPQAYNCGFCGQPICGNCLVNYEIRSKTHDGMIYHHLECDEKSDAKNHMM